MNFLVPYNPGNFLASWKPVSFSTRTLQHGVSKCGKVYENELGTEFFCVDYRIITVVVGVWFVSDRMSCIVLRGRWCNVIVMNVRAPSYIICATCWVSSDEMGIYGAAGKVRQHMKWQSCLCLYVRVLDTLIKVDEYGKYMVNPLTPNEMITCYYLLLLLLLLLFIVLVSINLCHRLL
jgi:hypothetical protein